jgi:hypothetical protein
VRRPTGAQELARTTIVIGLILGIGCTQNDGRAGSHDAGGEDRGRAGLVHAVRNRVESSDIPVTFDSSKVNFETMPSSILQTMRYEWASYVPPELDHGFAFAVAAVRDGQGQILMTPADLAGVLAGWYAKDRQSAIRACEELISVAGPGRDPRQPPVTYRSDTTLQGVVAMDKAAISKKAAPPTPRRETDDSWRVSIWSVEVESTRRYECLVPGRPESRQALNLVVVDSIPSSGFPLP